MSQVFSGSSNYMQEALGGTSHSASYSCEVPKFESHISEVHWRALNGDNYAHNEVLRLSILTKERRMFVGS